MTAKYKPFVNIEPGFYIEEELEAKGWSKGDLATITGINLSQISDIIHNKRPITIETAKLLGKTFSQSPQYWLNLYNNYKIRLDEVTPIENAAQIKSEILTHMPIADMVKKGWIGKWNNNLDNLIGSVKRFWDINELDFSFMDTRVDLAFKKSSAYEKYNYYFALTWYQMAKKCSASLNAGEYNRKSLAHIANNIAMYSYIPNGLDVFINELKKAGVKFFILPHLDKTYTDGAAFWDGDNPVIVWTGRYKRVDNFWFTIAHEIAHILSHLRNKDSYIIDLEKMDSNQQEQEANMFALAALKQNEILSFLGTRHITKLKILACSEKLQISPSLIVGQLQHLKIIKPYQFRNLIESDFVEHMPKSCFANIKAA